MFDKFSRSWTLVKASAAVLRSDKELLVFPLLSGLAAMLVVATFIIPVFALKIFESGMGVGGAILGFLFYLCQYFVIFFFNAALVGAAIIRLEGGDPTLADGFNAAKSRLGPILGYAAIAATVGMLLQALKNKQSNFLVRLIGSGLGVAWTLSTFLVVPVLVQQNIGPIDAIKESVKLLKRTWGENAIGNVGLGLAFGLMMFGVIMVGLLLAFVSAQVSGALAITIIIITVLAAVALGVVQSALSAIYSAALYRFATVGEAPQGFEAICLESVFTPK
ncbi:MAG: hypothetical protein H7147_12430 [Frankiaceae bacterium]|nr:hypothetical protein [Arenimonas sp.]